MVINICFAILSFVRLLLYKSKISPFYYLFLQKYENILSFRIAALDRLILCKQGYQKSY